MLQKKIVGKIYPLFRITKGNGNYGSLGTIGNLKKIFVQKPHQFYFRNTYNFSAVSIKDMKITYDPSKKT